MINEWVDTTGWTLADWEEFIDAYTTPGPDGCLMLGGCFSGDTLVVTSKGTVPIEDIKENDLVLSYNEETKENEYKRVLHPYKLVTDRIAYVITEDGKSITTTRTHLFYTANKGYIPACNLKAGDILQQSDGKLIKVTRIDSVYNTKVTVYNFEVEDNQNYYVGLDHVLVHNTCVAYVNLLKAIQPPAATVTGGYKFKPGHSASELTGCTQDTTPASKVLRANMKENGIKTPPYPNAAHHIVAANEPEAEYARSILEKYNIDINSADNGVFLPYQRNEYVTNETMHVGSHSKKYYQYVNRYLEEGISNIENQGKEVTSEDIKKMLEEIRNGLLNGTVKLNYK